MEDKEQTMIRLTSGKNSFYFPLIPKPGGGWMLSENAKCAAKRLATLQPENIPDIQKD